MSDRLQPFDHDASGYERPNQPWVCGRACMGAACPEGPSRRGRCSMTHACVPVKRGERWACTRPEGLGGPCEEGPLADGTCCLAMAPCRPTRSMARRRALAVYGVTGVALAAAIVLAFGTFSQSFVPAAFNPGMLSPVHAAYDQNCSACHGTVNDSIHVALLAVAAFRADGQTQDGADAACLTCHALPDSVAFNPHALDSTYLQARLVKLDLQEHLTDDATASLACTTCHMEHMGRTAPLVPPGNDVCQTCHRIETDDFEMVHNATAVFATEGGARWGFDHGKHQTLHFPENHLDFVCTDCHNAGRTDVMMGVNAFTASCGNCHHHSEQIQNVTLPLFQLPGIDYETLDDAGVSIGTWPADAGIDLESGVTAFTRLLLDDVGAAAADTLAAHDVWLFDLIGSEDYAADVATLAWSVKAALADVEARGATALQERVRARAGRRLPASAAPLLEQWAQQLETTAATWFPNLQEEVTAHQNGDDVPLAEYDGYDLDVVEEDAWTRDSREFKLVYTAQEHADPMVRLMFEAGVNNDRVAGLFPALSDLKMGGTCLKCHANAAASWGMDWKEQRFMDDNALAPANDVASVFDHGPHLAVTECERCHEASSDALHPFLPTPTSTCATCHGSDLTATMTCGSCHRYHNEMPETTVPAYLQPDSILVENKTPNVVSELVRY